MGSSERLISTTLCIVFLIIVLVVLSNNNNARSRDRASASGDLQSSTAGFNIGDFGPSVVALRTITKSEYHLFKQAIRTAKERIWNDWDISNFPIFLTLFEIPIYSWELQKYKFIKLIMERPLNDTSSRFIASFGGSSVTAGHDSYFREAYPQVFYDTMKPVFASVQVDLMVRNQALGNNPCYPYDACTATHLGDDADIATWEQSMNCGRDPRPVESFTRSLLGLKKKKPTVIYIASGTPAWQVADCVNITANWLKAAGNRTMSKREKEVLARPYKEVAATAQLMKAMTFLNVVNANLDPPQRVATASSNLADVYRDAAPMAQNVLALEMYKCLGPYTPDFSVKSPGGGVAWHPGKRGHKMRADSIAYALLSILDEAAAYLETALPSSIFSVVIAKELLDTANRYISSNNDIHANRPSQPVACGADVCSSAAECYTDYQPRVRNDLASQIVDSSPIALSLPHYAYNTSTEGRATMRASVGALEALQRAGKHAPSGDNGNASWTFGISFFDKNAVEKGFARSLGYLDRKYIYTSNGKGSFLSFAVNLTRSSAVWLCECQKGFLKYPASMGDLDLAAEVFVSSDDAAAATPYVFSTESATKLRPLQLAADQCYKTEVLARGRHVVTVVQKGEQSINIAYLIYF